MEGGSNATDAGRIDRGASETADPHRTPDPMTMMGLDSSIDPNERMKRGLSLRWGVVSFFCISVHLVTSNLLTWDS